MKATGPMQILTGVDCEPTWAVSPEHFEFVAPGQPVIPRERGSYPTGGV